jgi:hypothetical protein
MENSFSTNEDYLNVKRKGDLKSRTLSRTSDITEARNSCVIKVILLLKFDSIVVAVMLEYVLGYIRPLSILLQSESCD